MCGARFLAWLYFTLLFSAAFCLFLPFLRKNGHFHATASLNKRGHEQERKEREKYILTFTIEH